MNSYPKYIEVGGKRYPINTDFRIAIECNRIAEDETIGEYERALAIIYILLGEEALDDIEHHSEMLELIKKYMLCGKEPNNKNEEPDMDYVEDYSYIRSSFRSEYGIKLDEEHLHWWEFNEMIGAMSNSEFGNCCVLNRIRNLRNYDTKDIKDKKELDRINELKKQYGLKKNQKKPTEKQKQNAKEIFEKLNLRRE